MARVETKAPKATIRKRDRPVDMVDDVDYQIVDFQKYDDFYVGKIHVMETGEFAIVHNRYGAWFQGDPEVEHGPMGDLKHSVCAKLQARLHSFKLEQSKIAAQLNDNPFAAQVVPDASNNMFM